MNEDPTSYLPLVLAASSSELKGQPEMALSAALYLMSSMAAAGPGAGRCEALIEHLDVLGRDARVPALLRSTCAHLARQWGSVLNDLPTEAAARDAALAAPAAQTSRRTAAAEASRPRTQTFMQSGQDGSPTGEPPTLLH